MMLENGKGDGGFKAEIDSKNRLSTKAAIESALELLNEDGDVWSIPIDGVSPSGATKFLYLTNNGTNNQIIGVASIDLFSTVAGLFRFTKVTGTPGGTLATVTPIPLNLASQQAPPCLVQSSATITGLVDAGLMAVLGLQASIAVIRDIPHRWYIPPGQSLAIQAPAAAVVTGSLIIYTE